jgi:hypothetical protein
MFPPPSLDSKQNLFELRIRHMLFFMRELFFEDFELIVFYIEHRVFMELSGYAFESAFI